jgi:hypothetical protein
MKERPPSGLLQRFPSNDEGKAIDSPRSSGSESADEGDPSNVGGAMGRRLSGR